MPTPMPEKAALTPRFKSSSIYCSRYLAVRAELVGPEGFSDAEWDLTIF